MGGTPKTALHRFLITSKIIRSSLLLLPAPCSLLPAPCSLLPFTINLMFTFLKK
ncbi:hypothetical protein [Moorena sp. SIO4G3]|uniref:hypothetical protein n=1 Tax=Moorena sp. SIO4G3 TaxID=2607821 RepID=UPI00142A7D17|nr:hypothetical protein [Moorena sp. SIO4G3]NEO78132.1 hypothetical protein [Moorena sp. SIO4G3]